MIPGAALPTWASEGWERAHSHPGATRPHGRSAPVSQPSEQERVEPPGRSRSVCVCGGGVVSRHPNLCCILRGPTLRGSFCAAKIARLKRPCGLGLRSLLPQMWCPGGALTAPPTGVGLCRSSSLRALSLREAPAQWGLLSSPPV